MMEALVNVRQISPSSAEVMTKRQGMLIGEVFTEYVGGRIGRMV